MKKHLLFILAALLPMLASAGRVEIDDIWYNLVSKDKTAEVTFSDGTGYSGSITIPATVTHNGVTYSVTSIGDAAFGDCWNLTAITIPEGVTSIGYEAFFCCNSLTAITIPESVTSIGESAFYSCSSLTAITIPESVTSIGSSAFSWCSSLTTITIPEGVTSIGMAAFEYCSSLTAITIPEGVTSIGERAFSYCSSLTAITIPEGVTSIENVAFAGCSSLTDITLPEGVTSIGERAFYYCSSLTVITIPEDVTSIGYQAFYGCSSLTDITLPEGVTSIGNSAFSGCSSLTAITIPEGVTSIGSYAFNGCTSLTDITCEAITPPTVGNSYTFYNVNKSIPVYVPAGSVEAYKVAEGWSEFTNIASMPVPITHITLSQSSATLLVEESLTLTATVAPDNATDKTLTWSSSNPSVATVDNMGKVTAIASGTATIAATANDGSGVSAQCEVTVTRTAKVEIDGIWYNLVSKAKQAEVTFKGDSYNSYSNEYSGSITIPATVTHNGVAYSVTGIGDNAFDGCRSLTAITLPEGVTSIGEWAFSGCYSLTAITIPESVTSIGNQAFRNCSSLTAIIIPEGVMSIGREAFYYCSSLTAITIPESVTSIGSCAFQSCSSLTAIILPEGVTRIGELAFFYCSSLTAITIPEGVTSIEGSTFYGCSSLTAITIPESVTSIGSDAFKDCSSLTAITLPRSVGYISSNAFANCPELTDVYCYAESVPNTDANAFNGSYIEYATLHVPASAMNSYKTTAPWSGFGTLETIENVTPEKCATPTISYVDGKVVLTCETEGAKVITTIAKGDDETREDMEFEYIPAQTLTAYATKENYENSDEVTLTLCWIPCEEHEEEDDNDTGILTIPSRPVLISTQGGVITVSGLAEGTEIAVVTTNGISTATATATDGTATLATNLTPGTIAIVKIGKHSIKVVIK